MKIRVAMLDEDKVYLERIVSVFTAKFADKIEIHSFTDEKLAFENLATNKFDVFIANSTYDIDVSKLPNRCGFAYFVESFEIESYKDARTICKFQKAELIYKEILGVYSEKSSAYTNLRFLGDSDSKVYTFTSPAGGTGCSTVAAAFAKNLASRGYKVLYLNFEMIASTNNYFKGEGQFTFSDVIFSLKSRKANMGLKLESYVMEDASGVNFYSAPKTVLDMLEVTNENINNLISNIRLLCSYQYIVIDMEFGLDPKALDIFAESNKIIFVLDGTDVANKKLTDVTESIEILERQKEMTLLTRTYVMYNRFSNKSGKMINSGSISVLGGIPKYENAGCSRIADQISRMDVFDKLID